MPSRRCGPSTPGERPCALQAPRHDRQRTGPQALRLAIIAWGKAGRGPEAQLVARYLGRIPWAVSVVELADQAPPPPAPPGAHTVLLDERGESLSSAGLAARLGAWRDSGVREVRFLVGPHAGHSDAARAQADLALAFGAATWPHLLARAMLAEQLYRASAILAGHPYHRG